MTNNLLCFLENFSNYVVNMFLLDNILNSSCTLLTRYITQEGHKLDVGAPKPPVALTNAVSWRGEGVKYRKNEVFLDVIESVNLLVCIQTFALQCKL